MSNLAVIQQYMLLGFEHVIPLGFDHILFILAIFFQASSIRSIIASCTVFTAAHSISLGISASGYWVPQTEAVEPIIAFSILIAALGNIVHTGRLWGRLIMIFIFGIVHGLGFAGALQQIGLPSDRFLFALLSFNVGVELGQLAVIVAAYVGVSYWFANRAWYRARIVLPVSSAIACVALYWTIERLLQ